MATDVTTAVPADGRQSISRNFKFIIRRVRERPYYDYIHAGAPQRARCVRHLTTDGRTRIIPPDNERYNSSSRQKYGAQNVRQERARRADERDSPKRGTTFTRR